MRALTFISVSLCAVIMSGCVSSGTHQKTLTELATSRQQLTEAEKRSEAEQQRVGEEYASLLQEKTTIQHELQEAKTALANEQEAAGNLSQALSQARSDIGQSEVLRTKLMRDRDRLQDLSKNLEERLHSTKSDLANSQKALAEGTLRNEGLVQRNTELTKALTGAGSQVDALQARLEAEELAAAGLWDERYQLRRSLAQSQEDNGSLQGQIRNLEAANVEARSQARTLQATLDTQGILVAGLQEEQRRLTTGMAKVRSDNARLHTQVEDLEPKATMAKNLADQLSERDQKIGILRRAVEDRDSLAFTAGLQQDDLAVMNQRINELTDEMVRLVERDSLVTEERDHLKGQVGDLEERVLTAEQVGRNRLEQERLSKEKEIQRLSEAQIALAKTLEKQRADTARMEKERVAREAEIHRLKEAQAQLAGSLDRQKAEMARLDQDRKAKEADIAVLSQARKELLESLETQGVEKVRLEREKLAKDEEIRRLMQTHAGLAESLKAEIKKGNIRIQKVRDRLTIQMVDKILFDSGRIEIKPEGLEILHKISEVLKDVTDKQIRIEGHTDWVRIGPRLKDQFPTNWELSTARATNVVRFLMDKGGIDPVNLTASGHAATRPVASNEDREGRAQNRRIEIVLYPQDLLQITALMEP